MASNCQTSSAQRLSLSVRTIAASPSSGYVMAVTTAGMARMRQLTVVRGGWDQAREGPLGGAGPPSTHTHTCPPTGGTAQLWGHPHGGLPALPAPESLRGPVPQQKARHAAPRPSPARAPTCASPSAGFVTATRTVLMVLMRVSRPAAVSGKGRKVQGGQQVDLAEG